ncbi:MAG: hypothetical protein WC822_04920 [Candidatus Paceibacterota bacterium]|jgi:hypothetical protein
MNIYDLWQTLTNSLRGAPSTTPEDQEKILADKAERLENLAKHYETEASLRKRIVVAEKRIKAVKPSGSINLGGFGNRGGVVKAIAVVTILVVIIIVIMSKAC